MPYSRDLRARLRIETTRDAENWQKWLEKSPRKKKPKKA